MIFREKKLNTLLAVVLGSVLALNIITMITFKTSYTLTAVIVSNAITVMVSTVGVSIFYYFNGGSWSSRLIFLTGLVITTTTWLLFSLFAFLYFGHRSYAGYLLLYSYTAYMIGTAVTIATYFWLKIDYQHLKIVSQKDEEIRRIVQQYELVSKLQKENYLYAEKSEELLTRLRQLFEVEKIYRQAGLTSNDVCRMLGTNRTYLSKAINSTHQKSFQELINSHRIEEVKELFKAQQSGGSEYADYTMQAIAEMVGFNGTSAFYTAFKQAVGVTPTEYKRIIGQAKSSEPEFLSESGFTRLKDSQDFSENES